MLIFLLFFVSGCSRVTKQAKHLSYHTELHTLGLEGKPQTAQNQDAYKQICPESIVYLGDYHLLSVNRLLDSEFAAYVQNGLGGYIVEVTDFIYSCTILTGNRIESISLLNCMILGLGTPCILL